jgi:aminoglycoside phosphotransferase (APT) family kinase protein
MNATMIDGDRHPMQSSCPLTRLTLGLSSPYQVIVKQLAGRARHPGPPCVHDERREIEIYRSELAGADLEVPRFLGAHIDGDLCLLFLEEVDGIPLWQSGDPAAWGAAAVWLGRLHSRPAPRVRTALIYDERFFAQWFPRALRFAPGAGLESLATIHRRAIGRLAGCPPVFVHGDFYPANVLVRPGSGICAIDFELAGAGPAALDLAALLTALPDAQAGELVDRYWETTASARSRARSRDSLDELILCARLHLAVRWLGWLEEWHPPEHQTFDWATEAHAAAGALGGRR